MKVPLFKRGIWKKIAVALAIAITTGFTLIGIVWYTFFYIPNPKEIVHFESLGDTLEGTLYYPNDKNERYPAVILLHGSGKEKQNSPGFQNVAKAFVKGGFAVLVYDKRGVGKSGGTFKNHDFKKFIHDIYQAIDFLKVNPRINSEAIGLMTNSQSGFFAPELASNRPELAFIYNRVGPVVDFTTLTLYQLKLRMEQVHENSKAIDKIMSVEEDLIDYYKSAAERSENYNNDKEIIEEKMTLMWESYGPNVPFGQQLYPSSYDQESIDRIAYYYSYDPRVYFERDFDTPLYYSYAEKDINVPTVLCIEELKKIIAEGRHQIEYKVWPGVGHNMIKVYYAFSGVYPPGFLKEMVRWASEKTDLKIHTPSG